MYYEDLRDCARASEARQQRFRIGAMGWFTLVALGVIAHVYVRMFVLLPDSTLEFVVSVALWLAVLLAPLVVRARQVQAAFPHCSACGGKLDADRLQRALRTHACPACQHVFPQRAAPTARLIALERAQLPRVKLASEVEPQPAPVVEAGAPAAVDPNPYAAPPEIVDPRGDRWARAHSAGGCLLAFWYSTGYVVLGVLRTEAQLKAEARAAAGPAAPADTTNPDWQAALRVYALSRRRRAWCWLPWTVVAPTLVAALAGAVVYPTPPGNWAEALLAITIGWWGTYFFGLLILSILWNLLPKTWIHWLEGSPAPSLARVDEATGYYGLRVRFAELNSQAQLPAIRFRFRQQPARGVVLRLVHFDSATALEWTIPCAASGVWQEAYCDLRVLARECDPHFWGDEIHFTGDPAAALEVDDLVLVPRE